MSTEIELRNYRKRILRKNAKNKFDCIQYLFTKEQILTLTPILLASILNDILNLEECKIRYDGIRRWQIQFIKKATASGQPKQNISKNKPPITQPPENKKNTISLNYSTPDDKIAQPLIKILKK